MLGRFFRRLVIGAATALASFVIVKVAKRIFLGEEPKVQIEEQAAVVSSATVETKTEDSSAVVVEKNVAVQAAPKASGQKPKKAEVIDVEHKVLKSESGEVFASDEEALRAGVLPPELGEKILEDLITRDPGLLFDRPRFQAAVEKRVTEEVEAARKRAFEERERRRRDAEIRAEILMRMGIRVEQEIALTGRYFASAEEIKAAMLGIYLDDFGIARNSKLLRPLVEKTVLQQTPGTKEFRELYGEASGGLVPEGFLVPKTGSYLMTPEQEAALIRKWNLHIDRPMDLDKFETPDIQFFMKQKLLDSHCYFDETVDYKFPLWNNWPIEVWELYDELKMHFEGYRMNDEHEAMVYFSAMIAARNETWNAPRTQIPSYIAPALFKYCVFQLRKLIYTMESLGLEEERSANGPVADMFEKFLELITIPNPLMGDLLKHTPMVRVITATN
jgi:hypothetical protein